MLSLEDIVIASNQYNVNVTNTNLSWWNPGNQYSNELQKLLKIEPYLNIFNYRYSSFNEFNNQVKTKLAILNNNIDLLFFNNGTLAIIAMLLILKQQNIHNITIVDNSYFILDTICDMLDIKYVHITESQFIDNEVFTPVWLTNPKYSSGKTLCLDTKNKIKKLLQKNITVILDECLCGINDYCHSFFKEYENNLFYICSPHKYLMTNNFKFACLVGNINVLQRNSDYVDNIIGSLSCSSIMAIKHFISNNYDLCKQYCDKFIQTNIQKYKEISNQFCCDFDDDILTPYWLLCTKFDITDIDLKCHIINIIKTYKCSFIPFNLQNQKYLSFRINTLQDITKNTNNLYNILNYFNQTFTPG